jgi:hypothetical protein
MVKRDRGADSGIRPATVATKRREWAETQWKSAQINTIPLFESDPVSGFAAPSPESAQQTSELFADSFLAEGIYGLDGGIGGPLPV